MKSLVIGMGIGQLYKSVLEKAGHTVVTVDSSPERGADFISLTAAIEQYKFFDTAHVCTPNFTHFKLADTIAPYCKIVFVEKPGVSNSAKWQELMDTHPNTRFMMVKNNQWRSEFKMFQEHYDKSNEIWFRWINTNRVPNPGTWFTTKETAFGGVSRDLLPHLLSYVSAFCNNFSKLEVTYKNYEQRWTLEDVSDTEYGVVDKTGTYNVDDRAELILEGSGKTMHFIADWRSNDKTDISIAFADGSGAHRYELGLCPEEAYLSMITDCMENLNNPEFWLNQLKQDLWIHDMME